MLRRRNKRLNTFHMRCLCRIFSIYFMDGQGHQQQRSQNDRHSIVVYPPQTTQTEVVGPCLSHGWQSNSKGPLVRGAAIVGQPKLRSKMCVSVTFSILIYQLSTGNAYLQTEANGGNAFTQALKADAIKLNVDFDATRAKKRAATEAVPSVTYTCEISSRVYLSRIALINQHKRARNCAT